MQLGRGWAQLGIGMLVILSISCSVTERLFTRGQPRLPAAEEILPALDECNATRSVVISARTTRDEVNEFGTRLCEYELTISNVGGEGTVIPVLRVHRLDGYQDLDEYEWSPQGLLQRGASTHWSGNVFTYTDPDAHGPVANVADRVAAVYPDSECASLTEDPATLDLYSVPLGSAPCALPAGQ